jgi:polyisoprenoid-binding protein YceI
MNMNTAISPVISTWKIDPVHSMVEFRVKHRMISNVKGQFTGTARINRKDFGLTWNTVLETGGLLVREEIAISLDVQFAQA